MILNVKKRELRYKNLVVYKLTKKEQRLLLILADNEFHSHEELMCWCDLDIRTSLSNLIGRIRKKVKPIRILPKLSSGYILENKIEITY